MSIHCAMIIYPYNKPIRSTSFDEYENEHNMSPEEKIQYVKDRHSSGVPVFGVITQQHISIPQGTF